jgi:hypothetical protein
MARKLASIIRFLALIAVSNIDHTQGITHHNETTFLVCHTKKHPTSTLHRVISIINIVEKFYRI